MGFRSRPNAEVKSLGIRHIRLLSTRAATREALIDAVIDLAVSRGATRFSRFCNPKKVFRSLGGNHEHGAQRVMNVGIDR